MKLKFERAEGDSIVCKYGSFKSGEEYKVSEEVGKKLLKIPGFKETKNRKRGEK